MIQLPEVVVFYGTKGFFDDQTLTGDEAMDQSLALIAGFDEDCATSGDGDRTSSGDDVGSALGMENHQMPIWKPTAT